MSVAKVGASSAGMDLVGTTFTTAISRRCRTPETSPVARLLNCTPSCVRFERVMRSFCANEATFEKIGFYRLKNCSEKGLERILMDTYKARSSLERAKKMGRPLVFS